MERCTGKTVRFRHPFRLLDVEGLQPPGSYEVETREHQLEGVSFIAYRRLSTSIVLHHPTNQAEQVTSVDPLDLAAALERDAVAAD